MNSISVLCVLAVLVAGGQAKAAPKKPCCAPDTWEAYIVQNLKYERKHSTYSGQMRALTTQAYDVANSRIAFRVTGKNPFFYQRFILDFEKEKLYYDTETSCVFQEFHVANPFGAFCVPNNATYLGEFTMGGGVLGLDVWNIDTPGGVLDDENPSELDVAVDSCIPVYSLYNLQTDEYNVNLNSLYYNVSTTIKDASIFSPPAFCKEGNIEFDDRDFSLFGLQAFYGPSPYSLLGKKKTKDVPQFAAPSLNDIVNRIKF